MGEETSHGARAITRAPTLKITPQQKPMSIGPQRTLPFPFCSTVFCLMLPTEYIAFRFPLYFLFIFFNGHELFPAPCWDVDKLDLMKVFCRQPQLLWAHVYNGPVKTRGGQFSPFLPDLFSLFWDVLWGSGGKEVWYRLPFLVLWFSVLWPLWASRVTVNHCTKKLLWSGPKAALRLRYTALEGSLQLCPFRSCAF